MEIEDLDHKALIERFAFAFSISLVLDFPLLRIRPRPWRHACPLSLGTPEGKDNLGEILEIIFAD